MRSATIRAVVAAALVIAAWAVPVTAGAQEGATAIYLVRHAEKVDDSRDPELSEAGKVRAAELARVLGDAGVTHIWSTDLLRTRHTGAPLAERLGLTIETYNPGRMAEFAARLKATPGRHLVLGHSNTTPALVKALGGAPGSEIPDTEYDRLYVVTFGGAAPVTVQLRFGAPAR